MGDFGKDMTSIIVLIVSVGMMALLVGHAAGAGYLLQQGAVGLNTVLNTIELTPTATNGPGTAQTGNVIGGVFGGAAQAGGGAFALAPLGA